MTHGNATTTAKTALEKSGGKIEKATRNQWMQALTRYGYVARGILFAVIGFIALQVALGSGQNVTDQHGALATIAAQPFGRILLIVMVVGLIGFSLWGFIRAIFDPLNRGNSERGMAERLGFVISGLSYGSLVYPFLQLLVGQGSGAAKSQTQATQDGTAQILAQPDQRLCRGKVANDNKVWLRELRFDVNFQGASADTGQRDLDYTFLWSQSQFFRWAKAEERRMPPPVVEYQ